MTRLGRNAGAYQGDQISIPAVLQGVLDSAMAHRWNFESREFSPGQSLLFLNRPAAGTGLRSPRHIYLSAGIHGDEPAGPLAIQRLLAEDRLPHDDSLWICPCLNPTGFPNNTRENAAGIDLNRDYLHLVTPEIRVHSTWLREQPSFHLTLCLHEDWEANGFYCYEVNPDQGPSLAESIVQKVSRVCPIDSGPMIDGRETHAPGIIRPTLDPASRPQWPEALFLITNKTRLSYTLEAPSDFALSTRVEALMEAVCAAVEGVAGVG